MRKVSAQVAGAIVVSIVFVLVVGLIEIAQLDRSSLAVQPDPGTADSVRIDATIETQEGSDCMRMESELYTKLDQFRSCTVDTDCTLASFGCPFECVTSIGKISLDDLQREERSFQQECHRCESSCPATLDKWRAACVRQRCVVLDRSIDELQQETLRRMNESS